MASRYINRWSDNWTEDGPQDVVKSEKRPSGFHFPVVAYSRLDGKGSYRPYSPSDGGSQDWTQAANRTLEKQARQDFDRR